MASVVLNNKGDSAYFSFNDRLKIELSWDSVDDYDLCLFWISKDGKDGGVFSSEYRRKSDMGSLEKFPFMHLIGDQKVPNQDEESKDAIMVKSLDSMRELYLTIVDYWQAIHDIPTSFNHSSPHLDIYPDNGQEIRIIVDSLDEGPVYFICKIENENTYKKIINEKQVLTLEQAYSQIPGFNLMCSP